MYTFIWIKVYHYLQCTLILQGRIVSLEEKQRLEASISVDEQTGLCVCEIT